jgi:hypothetical protein
VPYALGIVVHTGWGACVCVGGSLRKPEIHANGIVEMLGDDERFCFHVAAEMPAAERAPWIAGLRRKAITNARQALASFLVDVSRCAIVARPGEAGDLEAVLESHTRIHSAEGCFYRDVLSEACTVPVVAVPPASLDASAVGKLAGPPWGKDQKLAALAAWSLLGSSRSR